LPDVCLRHDELLEARKMAIQAILSIQSE